MCLVQEAEVLEVDPHKLVSEAFQGCYLGLTHQEIGEVEHAPFRSLVQNRENVRSLRKVHVQSTKEGTDSSKVCPLPGVIQKTTEEYILCVLFAGRQAANAATPQGPVKCSWREMVIE